MSGVQDATSKGIVKAKQGKFISELFGDSSVECRAEGNEQHSNRGVFVF